MPNLNFFSVFQEVGSLSQIVCSIEFPLNVLLAQFASWSLKHNQGGDEQTLGRASVWPQTTTL